MTGFRPLWESFLFLYSMEKWNECMNGFPPPYGDLFYFYMKNIYRKALDEEFPSPLGIFFISILSYGNLTGYRENLHFAVQKVFSGKIRGFEAFNVL